jgi:hypothetical protein
LVITGGVISLLAGILASAVTVGWLVRACTVAALAAGCRRCGARGEPAGAGCSARGAGARGPG